LWLFPAVEAVATLQRGKPKVARQGSSLTTGRMVESFGAFGRCSTATGWIVYWSVLQVSGICCNLPRSSGRQQISSAQPNGRSNGGVIMDRRDFLRRCALVSGAGLVGAAGLPMLTRTLPQVTGLDVPDWFTLDALALEGGWERAKHDDGVTVYLKNEAGRALPVFKGIGTVDGSLFELLAVLDDATRHTEWMANCVKSKILKPINEFDRIMYNRTEAPWPVSDRDVVIEATCSANMERKEFLSQFRNVSYGPMPKQDGAVRMPRLRGFWRFEALDEKRTKATYQIDADPGGMLPDWVVERASVNLPIQSIVGLRRQVRKTRGKYDSWLAKFDPSRGGSIPARFMTK